MRMLIDNRDLELLLEKKKKFNMKLVDYLEKCLIYRHIRRFAD